MMLKERIEATNYALENEAMLDSVEKIALRNQLAILEALLEWMKYRQALEWAEEERLNEIRGEP